MCYLYIFTFLSAMPLSQVTGLENGEAFEKDGTLVETVKHNAQLALFLLSNGG